MNAARSLKGFGTAVALLSTFAILFLVVNWNANVKRTSFIHEGSAHRYRDDKSWASIPLDDYKNDDLVGEQSVDDDITRDDTCRKYLMNFLNGTTDAKDECEGMYNAWQAADCTDDKNLQHLSRKHKAADGNVTDDDVLIDDFYENWECCTSISNFYNRHCQDPQLASGKLLGIVSVLVVCGLVKSALRFANLPWIPDAGACIFVGSVVGVFLRLFDHEAVRDELTFNNDLFLQVMLPPIIFEAALSIDKRAFRRDLFPILTFAIFGTGFSALAIGLVTYYLSGIGSGIALPFLDSLLFGALMSSIDPVAVLGILSGVGVSQGDTLYILIFGESLLNDGVSIVLFDSLVRHMGDVDVVDQANVRDTMVHFFTVISGSIFIGAGCGVFCTLYFWLLHGKHSAVSEVALFFAWALIPYYIADGLDASGIISIMVMGFMLDYFVVGGFQSEGAEWREYMNSRMEGAGSHPVEPYFDRIKAAFNLAFSGKGHITDHSRQHVGFVAEVISSIMETAIFAYLGLFLFNDKNWDLKLTSAGLFGCISSRFVMVLVLAALINACVWLDLEGFLTRAWRTLVRRNYSSANYYMDEVKSYLDPRTQVILFAAGVRGAVSYALVQNIPVYDSVTKYGSHYKGQLKAMTSATIVIILFVFGALTYFTVQRPSQVRRSQPLTDRLMEGENPTEHDLDLQENHQNVSNSITIEIEGRLQG